MITSISCSETLCTTWASCEKVPQRNDRASTGISQPRIGHDGVARSAAASYLFAALQFSLGALDEFDLASRHMVVVRACHRAPELRHAPCCFVDCDDISASTKISKMPTSCCEHSNGMLQGHIEMHHGHEMLQVHTDGHSKARTHSSPSPWIAHRSSFVQDRTVSPYRLFS